jgi:hypothetical protein
MEDNNQNQIDQVSGTPVISFSHQVKPGVILPRALVVPTSPKLGDTFYSDGTRFKTLGAGTDGQVMVNKSGVPAWGNSVTGSTGSFAALQITSAQVSGSTGTTASLGPAGASGGGPTTATQKGWTVIYVAGVKCWVPVWV